MKNKIKECPVCKNNVLEVRQTGVRCFYSVNGKTEKKGNYKLAETTIYCSKCGFEK